MQLFKSKYEKELDEIIIRLEMNCSNNYKDAAQDNLRQLEKTFEEFNEKSYLKEKKQNYYKQLIESYQEKMKGYTHKDQKPFWT